MCENDWKRKKNKITSRKLKKNKEADDRPNKWKYRLTFHQLKIQDI